jgi:hypothetical protein
MLVVLVALTGLLGVGAFTVLSVQKGISQVGHERHDAVALYAAESGVAAAVDFLRRGYDGGSQWSAFVSPSNQEPLAPLEIPGNGVAPGSPGHLAAGSSWYEVTILNNSDDAGFAAGLDADARIIIRSVGHGSGGSTAIVEVEVRPDGAAVLSGRPCPGYAQRGIAEDGAGRNDCLGALEHETAIFTPGG